MNDPKKHLIKPTPAPPPFAATPPPPPPAPVLQPKTVRYSLAWFRFLMVFCLLIAWYFPVKILITYIMWPNADVGIRDSYEFVALAYEGISKKEGRVTPYLFKQQIELLKKNNYNPITLTDIVNLFEKNEPLPRKAILMTFDHGNKVSYFGTKATLRRAGWPAVMFVKTKPIEDKDQAALWWPYIKNMLRTKRWDLGVQSHDGFKNVVTSSSGREGHFMTTPMWYKDKKRFETLDEFTSRLKRDHEKALDLVKQHADYEPLAYAYPYGDFGQFQSRANLPRFLNMSMVENYYALGFISGNLALNTRYSDVRRLNRLVVRPTWSPQELIDNLDKSWPTESPAVELDGKMIQSAWIVDWGTMKPDRRGGLILQAATNATGAKMWLAGSNLSKNFKATIKFRLQTGQMGIYLRSSADGERFVYLGIDLGGGVWVRQMETPTRGGSNIQPMRESGIWLRQKHISADRFTLASANIRADTLREHTLDIYVRDNIMFTLLNGHPLFGQRIILRGKQNPGMLGVSVWSPQKGVAKVDIRGVSLQQQIPAIACWDSTEEREPHVFKWIDDHAYSLTELSPEWHSASSEEAALKQIEHYKLYRLLANINHLRLFPRISVKSDTDLVNLAPAHLADKAAAIDVDGIYINMTDLKGINMANMATWLQQCGEELKSRGMELMMSLPKLAETIATAHSVLAVVPGAKVVVDKKSALKDKTAIDQEKVVEIVEVPDNKDEELPLFYMISHIRSGDQKENRQVKIRRLEQEGWAAYHDNDYPKALRMWSLWLEEDSDSPRVLMLLGDVEVAMGNIDHALNYYNRSLAVDPGQFKLVVRRAELLDKAGRTDEARESLNLYARLFPGNIQILMAQIDWLVKNHRNTAALELIRRVLEKHPGSLEALGLQLRFLSPDDEEYGMAMNQLAQEGINPARSLLYGKVIWRNELLSLPYSSILQERVNAIANQTRDSAVMALYSRLEYDTALTQTTFPNGLISDEWGIKGGSYEGNSGKIRLHASPGHSTVTLRLRGSIHSQNNFVEATAANIQGDFWLYARRNEQHSVRFGYSSKGMLHLQIWRDSVMVEQRTMPWQPIEDEPMMFRLIVNDSGAMGYINDKPISESKLFVPHDMPYGWIGVAATSSDKGTAAVTLFNITTAPLPLRIAMLTPDTGTSSLDKTLNDVRRNIASLTVISPRCNGNPEDFWDITPPYDMSLIRLFSSYYRVWLIPMVDVGNTSRIEPERIIRTAQKLQADGFFLMLNKMPDKAELEKLNLDFALTSLKILLVVLQGDSIQVTGLAGGRDLVNTEDGTTTVLLQPPEMLSIPPQAPALWKSTAVAY